MKFGKYEDQLIRLRTKDGLDLQGFAAAFCSSYGLSEFGREKESIKLEGYQIFEGEIDTIEMLGIKRVIKQFCELTPYELYAAMKLRVDAFVVEQQCPYEELDNRDQEAIHLWLEEADGIQAYLRVLKPGVEADCFAIGRVVSAKRGRGLARMILEEGISYIEDEFDARRIYLEAQTYARGLYEKAGFRQISEEFLLDGIPHIRMIRESSLQKE